MSALRLPLFHRWFVRLALLAVLANALVPTLAHAHRAGLAAEGAALAGWLELCGAQGRSWVRLDGDGALLERRGSPPAELPQQTALGADCGYCVVPGGGHWLGADLGAGLTLAPADAAGWSDSASGPAPRARADWIHPAPRAPPQA